MEYNCNNLLKHTPYSNKLNLSFKRYMITLSLAKGVVPSLATLESVKELQKLKFQIDPVTNYISNALDYEMIVQNDDLSVIHVLERDTKRYIGQIKLTFEIDNTMHITTLPVATDYAEQNKLDQAAVVVDDQYNSPLVFHDNSTLNNSSELWNIPTTNK
uniref:Ac26 n=1 Tax=Helicoverpa armigera nucleopolyhedrovirus TaxID=51313 RepID=A0A482EQZ9_9ABAC|nr:ac26 [Helicoverpa armigera nucleopolyhedrovirus]